MADYGVVPASLAAKFGRMDAPFLLAAQEHLVLIDELLANYDDAGLVALARQLPFDQRAFDTACRGARPRGTYGPFEAWLIRGHRRTDVAAYCALAAQHAASKALKKIEVRQRETLAMLDEVRSMVASASRPATPLLKAAVMGKTVTAEDHPPKP